MVIDFLFSLNYYASESKTLSPPPERLKEADAKPSESAMFSLVLYQALNTSIPEKSLRHFRAGPMKSMTRIVTLGVQLPF